MAMYRAVGSRRESIPAGGNKSRSNGMELLLKEMREIKDQNSKLLRNIAERERGSFNIATGTAM